MSNLDDPLRQTPPVLHLPYKNLVVSGCSFSAGSSHIEQAELNPTCWSHFLLKSINFNRFGNLAIPGGGNFAAASNLMFYLENRFCNPSDTLVIFNLTEFDRIDTICPIDHPDATLYFSWDKDFGFSWIVEGNFSSHGSPFYGRLQKNMGHEQTIILNSLIVQSLFSYLENRGYQYYFMSMSQSCIDHAADFLQKKIKQNQSRFIDFPGFSSMREYVADLGLAVSDTDFHPSIMGYQKIADHLTKRLIHGK